MSLVIFESIERNGRMKKMKKITLQNCVRKTLASTMLFCCLTSGVASYACVAEAPAAPIDENGAVVRVEETEWRYRSYQGRCQRRLWSLTRGIWLTDWEDC